MGMILLPLLLMWLVAFGLSLRIGYVLAGQDGFVPEVLVCTLAGVLLALCYVALVFGRRKSADSLWVFQLVIDFALSKTALSGYTLLAAVYLFTDMASADANLMRLIYTGTLTLSLGTLLGIFSGEALMDKYGIRRTY